MPRGGYRPTAGRKRKHPIPPQDLVSPHAPSSIPTASLVLLAEDQILAKLQELALAGNPLCLRLALEQRERAAKVELLKEQTRNLRLRNQALKNHLEREGLPVDDENEYEPNEDPVQLQPALKMVGK